MSLSDGLGEMVKMKPVMLGFLVQLRGVLEKIIQRLPGVWRANIGKSRRKQEKKKDHRVRLATFSVRRRSLGYNGVGAPTDQIEEMVCRLFQMLAA